jgi:alkaline phosphatase D
MHPVKPERRQFLGRVALGTGTVIAAGLVGCDDDVTVAFVHGVASGDPLADRVILWTRATPSRQTSVIIDWEVARDDAFRVPVAAGSVSTGAARDYTVKVDVTGLQPGTVYFYRFRHGDTRSETGRTRTLPAAGTAQVRFALFSCANYPAGYFHVYAEAARHDDLDAVIHVGDYLYEYGMGEYATADALALGRVPEPTGETITLDHYRRRYAQYRGDRDLQTIHARHPFICVWDDHEIANDAYKDGAENHDDVSEGEYALRRAAAVTAWYEWLPVREPEPGNPLRTYRSFDFGGLVALHMLDTRHIGRDRQLDYADFIDPATGTFDAAGFAAALGAPDRQLLGAAQMQWLQNRLAQSDATWQVLGQQVLMGRMYLPAPLLTPEPTNPSVSFAQYTEIATAFLTYQAIAAQLTAAGQPVDPANLLAAGMTMAQLQIVNDPAMQAVIAAPSVPYNLDAWDGYPAAREAVYATVRALDKNLVVLSGDTHNAWANDLRDMHGNTVGVEFAGSSVSSPGLEEYLPGMPPDELRAGVMQLIPTLRYANTALRGYLLATFTPERARADWYFVDSVKTPQYSATLERSLAVLPGAGNRRLVEI